MAITMNRAAAIGNSFAAFFVCRRAALKNRKPVAEDRAATATAHDLLQRPRYARCRVAAVGWRVPVRSKHQASAKSRSSRIVPTFKVAGGHDARVQ
jgi:hypothetical protein